MYNYNEDDFLYIPGSDCPIYERVEYVRQRTISELEIYADDIGADSVQDLPQNVFTSALRHCCTMIFRPRIGGKSDYFKLNLRDHALIFALAQMFIDICDRYNKVCQVSGLAAFLGVSNSYLYSLAKYSTNRYSNIDISSQYSNINNAISNNIECDNNNYNSLYNAGDESGSFGANNFSNQNIIKELKEAKERQLQGLLIDGKGQLVGIIAILNHEYDYSKQDSFVEPVEKLTSTERQKALAEKYRVSALPDKLSDN